MELSFELLGLTNSEVIFMNSNLLCLEFKNSCRLSGITCNNFSKIEKNSKSKQPVRSNFILEISAKTVGNQKLTNVFD